MIIIILFSIEYICNAKNKEISNGITTLVIDAGHGGEDPGAVGKLFKEKDITLAVSLKLGKCIQEKFPDVKVIYTRTTDVFVPLHERADIANRNKADLFISIHVNSVKKPEINGLETYAMGLHTNEKNLEVAMKENAVITLEKDYTLNYEGYDPNSPESYIIFSLMQNTFLAQSLDFASFVQTKGQLIANRVDRGVRQAGFLVLWRTSMPSVLIELGYISNAEEERYLGSEKGQDELAVAICEAFNEYKRKIEDHSWTISVPEKEMNVYESKNTTQDSIVFKIQIFSTARRILPDAPEIKKCKQNLKISKIDEIYSNDTYKYAIGEFTCYQSAITYNKEVKKIYPDAFVIALKYGKIVPLNNIVKK